eukprot:gene564-1089_t
MSRSRRKYNSGDNDSEQSFPVIPTSETLDTEIPNNASSSDITIAGNRRKSQRDAAERSIVQFARSSKSSTSNSLPISSTPTGISSSVIINMGNETENWPGPFATAHAMIEKREEVKLRRLAAIAQAQEGNATVENDDLLDVYDEKMHNLIWNPKRGSLSGNCQTIPTLIDICLDVLFTHFESIEDFGNLSFELRERLCDRLGRSRMLKVSSALSLASPGLGALSLTECSELCENDIIQILEKMCSKSHSHPHSHSHNGLHAQANNTVTKKRKRGKNQNAIDNEEGGEGGLNPSDDDFSGKIEGLYLKNCGHGFGDRAALTLAHLGDPVTGPGLEDLGLVGCYRLGDPCLAQLLSRCACLRSLDLSVNSRLGRTGIAAIATHLPQLTSLRLSGCLQLQDDDIMALIAHPDSLKTLQRLELDGLTHISDASVSALLRHLGRERGNENEDHGHNHQHHHHHHHHYLTHFSVKDCVGLSDGIAVALRDNCNRLVHLDVGGTALSTAALLGLFISHPGCATAAETTGIGIERNTSAGGDVRYQSILTSPLDRPLEHLEVVGLGSLASVTDDVIQQLCLASGSSLTDLDIAGCHQITSRALMILMMHASSTLRRLNVSFIRSFTEDALGCLLEQHCSNIQLVQVWGCSQLTEKFFGAQLPSNLVIEGRATIDSTLS